MPTALAPRPQRSRAAFAAVALAGLLACPAALTACEYQYDDGRLTADASPPTATFTDAALPADPSTNRPVTGAELDQWLAEALPEAGGQVFHTASGLLDADETRHESTTQLPSGTYALTLVCRSTRRVSFTIRDKGDVLVDLSLRCGHSRVNVVQLDEDAVLRVRIESRAPANFAYRVSRI